MPSVYSKKSHKDKQTNKSSFRILVILCAGAKEALSLDSRTYHFKEQGKYDITANRRYCI